MAKAVTNEEVEDVLSSIRRLVSEDRRPLATKTSDTPVAAEARTDRLMLTPALRVSKPHAAAEDAGTGDAGTAPLDLGSVATNVSKPLSPHESDEADALAMVQTEDMSGDAAPDVNTAVPEPLKIDPEPTPVSIEPVEAMAAPAMQSDVGSGSADDPTLQLTAKIAALEAAVSEIAHEWEPDGDEIETFAAAGTHAMAWEDDVDLDATGSPIAENASDDVLEIQDDTASDSDSDSDAGQGDDATDTPVAAAVGNTFCKDDQIIDEDALRDLVSEIVRAELQGALGERITRNVRKLVRREIHRALTAKELE